MNTYFFELRDQVVKYLYFLIFHSFGLALVGAFLFNLVGWKPLDWILQPIVFPGNYLLSCGFFLGSAILVIPFWQHWDKPPKKIMVWGVPFLALFWFILVWESTTFFQHWFNTHFLVQFSHWLSQIEWKIFGKP